MKIDLVIWTYNSELVLEKCLSSIDEAIPGENICHRIAVDGGSRDGTVDILQQYNWKVEKAPQKGIPYQANYALAQVDTEYFAAFEHDIILNPEWFDKTSRIIRLDETIGAVQGIRLYTGSKTMQAIEDWAYRAKRIPIWVYSIDNTLFRTEAVRDAGGFSDECMASADGILRRNMFKIGFKWITDPTLISRHYRKDFLEQFKHQIRAIELARYFWSSNPESNIPRRIISMFGGNPLHLLRMTRDGRMLRIPLAWVILRYERGIYMNPPHEEKAIKPVAMDEWYLKKFKEAVQNSPQRLGSSQSRASEPSSAEGPCLWCGKVTWTMYQVPSSWGELLPTFRRKIGRRFLACSREHAGDVAEKIFKNAFEYIAPQPSLRPLPYRDGM